jgi:phosphoglycolate phosphatase-like HAD superfamily hydrolase
VLLVLFDIDGTLVWASGAHNRAFADATRRLFGSLPDVDPRQFSGSTDTLIVQALAQLAGATAEEAVAKTPEYLAAVTEMYQSLVSHEGGRILPGVVDLLHLLQQRGHCLGLTTGNVAEIARLKLEHFGLWKYFPVGGFGDQHGDRAELIKMAVHRAHERCGFSGQLSQVVYVGDTPRDVAAARAAGVRCVVPLTNRLFSRAALEETSPDLLLEDLTHHAEFLAFLDTLA